MPFDIAIFLAALGITTLELVEAAAVGLALRADSGRDAAYGYVALGAVAVFAPMFLLGALIALLPISIVRLVAAVLLLYFGLRLARSARRAVLRSRKGGSVEERFEKGTFVTGFSVGAIEAFEAAIVLVALLPNNYGSTVAGMGVGIALVVVSTYILRNQVRKVKQADTKILVSSLLLSFATFWFGEAFVELSDLFLIPLFIVFAFLVYRVANSPSPATASPQGIPAPSGDGVTSGDGNARSS